MIRGGGGGDAMLGFGGDDIYFVADPGDRILEDQNNGFDIVYTNFSYGLTAGRLYRIALDRFHRQHLCDQPQRQRAFEHDLGQ